MDNLLEKITKHLHNQKKSSTFAVPSWSYGQRPTIHRTTDCPRQADSAAECVFVEGKQIDDLSAIFTLAQTLTPRVYEASQHDRERLHVAGVFANNFTNHMYAIAADILKDTHIPFQVLLPLIDQTAEKVHHLSPHDAQTGPAKRRDEQVMNHHLALLKTPDQQQLYTLLSKMIIQSH